MDTSFSSKRFVDPKQTDDHTQIIFFREFDKTWSVESTVNDKVIFEAKLKTDAELKAAFAVALTRARSVCVGVPSYKKPEVLTSYKSSPTAIPFSITVEADDGPGNWRLYFEPYESDECVVCCEEPPTLHRGCGHVCLCDRCSSHVHRCPLCT